MKLSDAAARNAKPSHSAFKLADGEGLFLLVNPNGSRLWRLKYRYAGKEKLISFGAYPEVTLAEARERKAIARRQLRDGLDPVSERRAVRTAQLEASERSFKKVASLWWEHWKGARTERHAGYVWRRLEADAFPEIGSRSIDSIKPLDLVRLVKLIEKRDALEVARRVLNSIGQVFRYAVAHGLAERNPVADMKPADVMKPRQKANYARIDASEVPVLLRKIEGYRGYPATRIAMQLMALTFVRTSELINARWSEFDLEKARWDIPPARMKMRTPHIVPLAPQAVELLRVLHQISGHREILFPGERDHSKCMSNNTILKALERMGYKGRMTGHGFRGLASTLLHEQNYDHHHIELQLAHAPRDAVSAAYNHARHLPARTKMMAQWADYLDVVRLENDFLKPSKADR